jgi:hypothetical protein
MRWRWAMSRSRGSSTTSSDGYMYWQVAAEFAKQLSGSRATIDDRKGSGPKNQIDKSKAIAFFDRHGNGTALRRGVEGVRNYVAEILPQIPS